MQPATITPGGQPKKRSRIYYGWWVALAVAMAQFTQSAGIFPVLGVLIKPMTEEFGWSRTTFTAATSIGTLIGGLAGPLIGPYVDRVGGRRILLVAFSVLGATSILQAFIVDLWQFYAIQITSRFLVLGVISLSIQIILPKWFVLKRARAIAISGLGGRFGNAITPLYVQFLVSTYNWRVGTIASGIVTLAITLLPIALFVRRQPEDMGLLPDGVTHEEKARLEAEAATSGKKTEPEVNFSIRQVMRMPAFYYLVGSNLLGMIVGPALNLHMIPYFTDKGLSPAVAVSATTVLFVTGAIGSMVFGFLAERFGVKRVLMINYVLTGLVFVFLLMVNSPPAAMAWAVFSGVVQGGGLTLNQVMFPDYFGRESLGAIRGWTNPLFLTANAAGPLIAAMAYDASGSYFFIFALFGLFRLGSALFVLLAKPPVGSPAEIAERRQGRAGVA